MKILALTAHALDRPSLARLGESFGPDLHVLSLADLRSVPLSRMIARLRQEQAETVVVVAMGASAPFAPILMAAALLIPTRTRLLLDPEEKTSPLPIPRIITAITALFWDSLHNIASWIATAWEARSLGNTSPMKAVSGQGAVLYLQAAPAHSATIGGAAAHTAGVINGLIEDGRDVAVLTSGAPPMLRPNARIVRLQAPSSLGLPVEAGLFRHHRAITRQAIDVAAALGGGFVYARMTTHSLAAATVSRRLGLPLVLEYNGSEVWVARNWGRPLRFEATALRCEAANLRHAHLVVTVSEPLKDDLLARGVEPERVLVHPNAVDPAVFDPSRFRTEETSGLRKQLGIRPDALVFGFIGTFGRWHGAEVMARAIALLAREHRPWLEQSGIHFLLVGDGATRGEAEAELERADAGPFATFAGLVPQAMAPLHLAAMDVLVSPHVGNKDGSPFFGSPTKLFEYLAMGRPVIASDLDQIGTLLRGEPCARLVPPGDTAALAQAIMEVASDSQWRAMAGPAARSLALEKFTWNRHVAAILAALSRLTPAP